MDPKTSLNNTPIDPQQIVSVDEDGDGHQYPTNPRDEDGASDVCFLYDTDAPPTCIEKLFGEPYHVSDKYPGHQISLRFIFTLTATYTVEGCLDWILIAVRYYGAAVWDIGPSQMQKFRTIITFVT